MSEEKQPKTRIYMSGIYKQTAANNVTLLGAITGVRIVNGVHRRATMVTYGMPELDMLEGSPDLDRWEYVGGGFPVDDLVEDEQADRQKR